MAKDTKKDTKKLETTKIELLDQELAFIWQCIAAAQIPTTAAAIVVGLQQKLGPLMEARFPQKG